jgi:hypothetical protein
MLHQPLFCALPYFHMRPMGAFTSNLLQMGAHYLNRPYLFNPGIQKEPVSLIVIVLSALWRIASFLLWVMWCVGLDVERRTSADRLNLCLDRVASRLDHETSGYNRYFTVPLLQFGVFWWSERPENCHRPALANAGP